MKFSSSPSGQEPIAIIGMACRFPGARNYEEYWQNLDQGLSSITEIPTERWDWKAYWGNPLTERNKSASKWGGFIKDAACFDASFFRLSGKEAESMDPQQRIMLELSWQCFEDAGIRPSQIMGSNTGVFVGVFNHDYKELSEHCTSIEAHHSTGTAAAIIPNRLSYYYDFSGPSVPVDTACSSSLQAMHLAAQSLQLGECDLALAGGISLLFTPTRHISFSKTGMLSPTGSCKTFDNSADGYVRGEGAGLILLKPLSKALENSDNIYGILKGSAVNHSGKTYTLTYPNAEAQAAVITTAMQRGGVKPDTISYVEAHGTGTPKGDPIEFEGLVKAFMLNTETEFSQLRKSYCGIGSVKTNIGHLESAAGIAGVIKVLLAMKYKKLPALLNFQYLNHRISLENSPFYIVDRLQDWKPIEHENGKILPRRAGISSFGFGGTNAHVILEEFPNVLHATEASPVPCLVCLSAKTTSALQQKIVDLQHWLDKDRADVNLTNISFTLLTGRDHFDMRIAFVVHDITELKEALRNAIIPQAVEKSFLSTEQVAQGERILQAFQEAKDLQAPFYPDKLARLSALYVQGYDGDWSKLFREGQAQRISITTYPFEKVRYWLPDKDVPLQASLHPQLHESSASAAKRQYTFLFTGEEPFLKDHVIKGKHILPGVAYLEMVRKAMQLNHGKETASGMNILIKNVVWVAPLVVVDQPVRAILELSPKEGGQTVYEIYTQDANDSKILHSQGIAYIKASDAVFTYDLTALQSRCTVGSFAPNVYYETLKKAGFTYGPSHQAIVELHVGEDEVIAKLALDDLLAYDLNRLELHPSFMDAALQTTMAWLVKDSLAGKEMKVLLPFAVEELEVYKPCSKNMWAIARYSKDSGPASKVQKLDIDLCDTEGDICVRMMGFSSRLLEKEVKHIEIKYAPNVLRLGSYWEERILTQVNENYHGQHIVLLCDLSFPTTDLAELSLKGMECLTITSDEAGIDKKYIDYGWQVLKTVQRLIEEKPKEKMLLQVIVPSEEPSRLLAGLYGLLKTVTVEYSRISVQLIEWPNLSSSQTLTMIRDEYINSLTDQHIRYKDNKRWVKSWKEITRTETLSLPYKSEGVYLITGGAGELGYIFSEEIASRTKDVTLILAGRSALSMDKRARLDQLQQLGVKIVYKQTDISDVADVTKLFAWIKSTFGNLDGIFHGAGLIRDNYIAKKTKKELQEVLAPKVSGLVNLDEASRDIELDFFVVFSSIMAVLGNAGQADYAFANAFMDEYAQYRNTLVAYGKRKGKTVSINWPLWEAGGMQIDDVEKRRWWLYAGMKPLSVNIGIESFYLALHAKADQVLVMEGDLSRLEKRLIWRREEAGQVASQEAAIQTVSNEQTEALPIKMLLNLLKQQVVEITKIPIEHIDTVTGFDEYGFDSILYTEFTNRLNDLFNLDVSPTVFFEHSNLEALSIYLHKDNHVVPAALLESDPDVRDGGPQILTSDTTTLVSPQRSNYPEEVDHAEVPDNQKLIEGIRVTLIQLAAEILKIPADQLDASTGMEEYGFDSILYTEFANKLNDAYGLDLAPTLFFEHQTLEALALYLINEWSAIFANESGSAIDSTESMIGIAGAAHVQIPPVEQVPISTSIVTEGKSAVYPEPIAIIGMSGKFPKSPDLNALWQNLLEERDCISEIPIDRWDWQAYYGNPVTETNKTRIKWGGFLEDLNTFDPGFFNISPGEAAYMDPQQRLLMMYAWKVIEDAGYAPQSFSGSNTALFAGIANHDFSGLVSKVDVKVEGYTSTGIISSVGPNRISYFLNIHGPSEPIDTACSSSLVAIHRAVCAIQMGDCDMAIAGGVHALLSPQFYISFNKAGMLSEDGRCKTFSDRANGYVRGEGVGMILLKRLADAERDGDHIYGVVRSTAENHGGRANSLTAPSIHAQAALLKRAYSKAGIDPRTVTYIEAHGTGTKLGDPIEIDALKGAFAELYRVTGDTKMVQPHCGLGSIKTNIGHLEYAAGIAGVLKVLLQLQHKTLIKSLYSETINPYIKLENSPFYVVQKTQKWEVLKDEQGRELPLRAGVSSFGFGGVNAHVVIEEYVPSVHGDNTLINNMGPFVFVLSAKRPEQLSEQVIQLLQTLDNNRWEDAMLPNIAYTLQVGRNAMEERLGLIAKSVEELKHKLCAFLDGKKDIAGLHSGRTKRQKKDVKALSTDDDPEVINQYIAKGDYEKVIMLWIDGHEIDWVLLYKGGKPCRLSLPTYPFAKENCQLKADLPPLDASIEVFSEQKSLSTQPAKTAAQPRFKSNSAFDQLVQILIRYAAQYLKIGEEEISPDVPLDEYGFDLVLFTQFANELNEAFGLELTATIFFKHIKISELARYLQKEWLGMLKIQTRGEDERRDQIKQILIQHVSKLLKTPEEHIDPEVGLNEYGFDSILFTQLANELNEAFALDLTPTIFFEHSCLNDLTAYLECECAQAFTTPLPLAEQRELLPERSAFFNESVTNINKEETGLEPIAIIGLSVELPMAKDIHEFWKNLVAEKDCVSEIPPDRWDWKAYPDVTSKWGGFIADMAAFDPLFFNISPAEALHMDPQQRLLMMHVWKAIEDAGYNPLGLAGSNTGIFTGISCFEYDRLLAEAGIPVEAFSSMGMVPSLGPNRMSYFLDIHGPSQPVETACSSSLVALNRAVEAIQNRSCDLAIAGGVNTLLSADLFTSLSLAKLLSPEGRCKTFSDRADGYVRGEGVGMVLLKRLKEAEKDGDHIYGVIRGVSENHGGRANTLTSPNPKAQVQLLQMAYQKAGIDPRTITYIETHGTGTALGDPIEINALKGAFSNFDVSGDTPVECAYCGLGSVKTNIGHLEIAAGIAGLAKVLMQLKHKTLVKSLYSEKLNPHIRFNDSPFYIVQKTQPWLSAQDEAGNELPRRAGISSFGFGGVNAHVIIEEYIPPSPPTEIKSFDPKIIILSARNKERLREYAESLLKAIKEEQISAANLESTAYTLQVGREHMEERLAILVYSVSEFQALLEAFAGGQVSDGQIYQDNSRSNKQLQTPSQKENVEYMVQEWIRANEFSKLAAFWVKGGNVDWTQLYGSVKPGRISLPSYPFARNRYWVKPTERKPHIATDLVNGGLLNSRHEPIKRGQGPPTLQEVGEDISDELLQERGVLYFKTILGDVLHIAAEDIAADEPLEHYGIDSIIITKLVSDLRKIFPFLENSVVFDYPTINELVEYLRGREKHLLIRAIQPKKETQHDEKVFKTLIHLNHLTEGKPVFWVHPVSGGVESYRLIAESSKRPFYGIIADDWIDKSDAPMGIPAMAAYYIRAMQVVQPAGPYDLGGFSLGGALAYEMTRQLQLMEQQVDTLVMLDSVYAPGQMDKFVLSYKSMVLQTANLFLLAKASETLQSIAATLIHRKDVTLNVSDNDFLNQIIARMQQKGLRKSAGQIDAIVRRGMKIQQACKFTTYQVLPLPDPEGIKCYYFKNSNQSFYGELAPYCITIDEENIMLEKLSYWEAWKKQIPHFNMADLQVANHLTLLNNPVEYEKVLRLCNDLYVASNVFISNNLRINN